MICHICHRAARGFGYHPRLARKLGEPTYYCSREHQKMIDKDKNEVLAIDAGGNAGGEYLDSINKTDLEKLSVEEWDQFVECIVTGYVDHLTNQ